MDLFFKLIPYAKNLTLGSVLLVGLGLFIAALLTGQLFGKKAYDEAVRTATEPLNEKIAALEAKLALAVVEEKITKAQLDECKQSLILALQAMAKLACTTDPQLPVPQPPKFLQDSSPKV